jgi:hypothetical protein
MRKNIKILLLIFVTGTLAACSVNPAQMFIASGINGNGCCDNETVVVITKDANGQTTVVTFPSSSASPSASPTVTPSASVSPSSTAIPSPSATASPVPSASVSPSATATASPSTSLAASGA